jgi:hypothetical protein
MLGMLHFATLVIATLLAAAAAVGLDWALLRLMFVLMHPASARQKTVPKDMPVGTASLSRGAVRLTRAYALHR